MTDSEEIEYWRNKYNRDLIGLAKGHSVNLEVIEKCYEVYNRIGIIPIHRHSYKYHSYLFTIKFKEEIKSIVKYFPPNDVFTITGYLPFQAQFIIDPGNSFDISFFSCEMRINIGCTMFPFDCVKEYLKEFKLKSNYYYQAGMIYLGKNISCLISNDIPENWDDGNEYIVSEDEFRVKKNLEKKQKLFIDTKQNAINKEIEAYNMRLASAKNYLTFKIEKLKSKS